jgi:hypothetical protein
MPYHLIRRTYGPYRGMRGLGATGCVVTQGQPNGGAAVATDYGNTAITLSQAQALAGQLAPFVPGLVPFEQSSPQFPLFYSGCNGAKAYGLQIPPVPTAGSAGNAPSFSIQNAGAILQIMSTTPGPLRNQGGSLYWGNSLLFNLPSYAATPGGCVGAECPGGAGLVYNAAGLVPPVAVPAPVLAPSVAPPVAPVVSGSPVAASGGEPVYVYATGGNTGGGAAPASSGFDLSSLTSDLSSLGSLPWWAYALAAVGLYMVTK